MYETDPNDMIELSIADICESCGLSVLQVTEYIQEGLIDLNGNNSESWRFTESHLILITKVSRLERDLRLNPAGAVLALDLMDEIDRLKAMLKIQS